MLVEHMYAIVVVTKTLGSDPEGQMTWVEQA